MFFNKKYIYTKNRKLKLYVTGENDSSEGCISIFLKNLDAEIDNSVYICSSYTFFIRNCDDCTCFYNNGGIYILFYKQL